MLAPLPSQLRVPGRTRKHTLVTILVTTNGTPHPSTQIAALVASCSGRNTIDLRDRALITLMLETGARRSEVIGLDVEDIDFLRSTARIRNGKGDKPRETIFGPATSQALRKYLRARKSLEGPLFLGVTKERLGYAGIGFAVKRRGEAAGIEGLHPHILRHTWCHYALTKIDSADVQTLAGWSSPRQLERYGAVMKVSRALAAGRANPVLGIVHGR